MDGRAAKRCPKITKVFWFFFSKKNRLTLISGRNFLSSKDYILEPIRIAASIAAMMQSGA
jgi:hypothetical protein